MSFKIDNSTTGKIVQKLKSSVESLLNLEVPDKKIPAAALDLLKAIKKCALQSRSLRDRVYEYSNKCYLHPKGKVVWHGVVEPDHTYEIEGHKLRWKSGKDLIESAYLVIYTTPKHDKGCVDLHWFSLDILEAEVKQVEQPAFSQL